MTPDLKRNRIENAIVPFQLIFVVFIGHICSTYAVLPPYGIPTYRRDEGSVPKYKYSYNVQNVEGGQHGHRVYMNGQRTSGKYYVKLNGGTTQDVEYYTDRFGYHPKVSYQNNLDSTGSSVARVVFGSYIPYNFTNIASETNRSTSSVISNGNDDTPTIPRSIAFPQFDKNNSTNETLSNVNVTTLNNNDSINVDASNATSSYEMVDSGADPILYASDIPTVFVPPLSQAPALVFASQANIPATSRETILDSSDVYLHPEMNEIAKGLVLNKLVSIAPRIKLIKPIIVTDASIDDNTPDFKSDQIVDSNQPRVYASEASNKTKEQETSTAHTTDITTASIRLPFNDEKPKTIVDIEPQTVEEKAVITTTVDIAKSLPLTVNLAQEVDNHLNEGPLSNEPMYRVPNVQMPLAPQVPPFFGHLRHPLMAHPYVYSTIGQYHLSGRTPLIQPTFTPTFQYIPIPVLQHQPNPIPLNNQNHATTPLPFNVTHLASVSNEDSKTSNSEMVAKRAPIQASQTHFLREPSFVKDDYRRPTYSSGYGHNQHSKSYGNSPHHFVAKYQDRTYATGVGGYNTKLFSKDTRKAPKLAPFKPSHPLWDSIYPPQHMYYIPYYVVDKIPGDRKTRESFRNHRRLRRLFVEYGGFKPPLIPSTLLEIEDTSDKTEVPKETVKHTNT